MTARGAVGRQKEQGRSAVILAEPSRPSQTPSFLYVLFHDWIFPEPRHSRHPSHHSHRL